MDVKNIESQEDVAKLLAELEAERVKVPKPEGIPSEHGLEAETYDLSTPVSFDGLADLVAARLAGNDAFVDKVARRVEALKRGG